MKINAAFRIDRDESTNYKSSPDSVSSKIKTPISSYYICLLFVLITSKSTSIASLTPRDEGPYSSSSGQSSQKSVVSNWIRARCDGYSGHRTPPSSSPSPSASASALPSSSSWKSFPFAVWMYEGALYDPLVEGKCIAQVHGLEVLSKLADYTKDSTTTTRTTATLTSTSTTAKVSRRERETKVPTQDKNSDDNNLRTSDRQTRQDYIDTCQDLKVGKYLTDTPSAELDSVTTLLTRKIFCYTNPSQTQLDEEDDHDHDETQSLDRPSPMLRSIQLRPNGPIRTIPTGQVLQTWDTATTFLTRGRRQQRLRRGTTTKRSSTSWSDTTDQMVDLIVHSEWPNGDTLFGTATNLRTTSTSDKSQLEFTIFTRPRSKHWLQFPDLTPAIPKSGRNKNNNATTSDTASTTTTTTTTIAPKRSSWIQFGNFGGPSKQYGVRETYSYTFSTPPSKKTTTGPLSWLRQQSQRIQQRKSSDSAVPVDCQVRYTRYGEGPPFYAPGRMCTLELVGRRITNPSQLSPILASILQEHNLFNNSYQTSTALVQSEQDWQSISPQESIQRFRQMANRRQANPSSNNLPLTVWTKGSMIVAKLFGRLL